MNDARAAGRNASPARRKVIAFVLSGIFPGLGQLYNRQPVKGLAFVVAGAALSWLTTTRLPSASELLSEPVVGADVLLLSGVLLAVWIWSLADAWRAAGR